MIPERAWPNKKLGLRYAFGEMEIARDSIFVLLHKDRDLALQKLLTNSDVICGRWKGRRKGSSVYLYTPGGASDVGDCIQHATLAGARYILYCGTCGSIHNGANLGDLCFVRQGWFEDSYLRLLADPVGAVSPASSFRSRDVRDSIDVLGVLQQSVKPSITEKSVFTTAAQSIESISVLNAMEARGADLVDMESGVAIACATQNMVPSAALLWCTDHPVHHDFYDDSRPNLTKYWEQWPTLLVDATEVLSELPV